MARILYFDCFSGVSGDMLLGALLDAGLPLDSLQAVLAGLGVDDRRLTVTAERVSRAGVSGTKFRLVEGTAGGTGRTGEPARTRGHRHAHPHAHAHQSLERIEMLIARSALSATGRARAIALFRRLAAIEAAIHQVPAEQVHLHEVGALDSIVDIVGTVYGLEWFGADEVVASPLNVGSGTVRCEHGVYPVPAPATASLLAGIPVYSTGTPAELVTPTGALLVTDYVTSYGPMPAMTIERIGYGAGDRDLDDRPNLLRLFVGGRAGAGRTERVVTIECEIDDMNPQIFGALMERLYEAGALEVFYIPVQMKKNRPGTLVTVIAPPERRAALADLIFRETTTIGVRFQDVVRECLEREVVTIETPIGTVRFKVASRDGVVVNAAPEFDDCARRAAEHGLSVKEAQALASRAYFERRSQTGSGTTTDR